ncbi:MAG: glycosyltransferase [Chloroflexota bacterium]|nr:glycosyltransferase [Chloroflexota bacterium]
MKIALTTDSFIEGQGGVSTAVAALARELLSRGHQVIVYTAIDPSHKHTDLDIVGLRALHYERFPGGRAPMAPISLVQELVDFDPDVIHNHSMGTMGIQALAAARLLGLPILGTCHVFLAGFLKYAPVSLEGVPLTEDVAWRYTTAFFNRFPQVTTPSEAMQRELIAHGLRSPVAAVSNGVNIDLFSPPPGVQADDSRPPTLIHVGRLSYEKRVDIALRAFAHLASDHPDVNLQIIGDGPEADSLKTLAAELGVAEQVQFTGFVPHDHLPEIYRQADIFVTASPIETQGLVALEAMACGLPIVGVDALALPDLIRHGINGYLVMPEDEQAIAEAVSQLLQSSTLRRAMGRESRRLALQHSMPEIAQAYERLYEQVCSQPPPPLLSRIPKKLDPSVAWSAFQAESQALKDAGVEKVWEVSRALRRWGEKAFTTVVEQVHNGLSRSRDL